MEVKTPPIKPKYSRTMKRLFYILLSLLGFGSISCTPTEEAEVAMYAAPYTEYHPSSRVDIDAEADADGDIVSTPEEV